MVGKGGGGVGVRGNLRQAGRECALSRSGSSHGSLGCGDVTAAVTPSKGRCFASFVFPHRMSCVLHISGRFLFVRLLLGVFCGFFFFCCGGGLCVK